MADMKTADNVIHYKHNQPLGHIATPHTMRRVLTAETWSLITVFHKATVTFSYLNLFEELPMFNTEYDLYVHWAQLTASGRNFVLE